jgi:DNA ligase (NAD+)
VDIILDDKDANDDVAIRQLLSFMTTLKIPYLSQGNITKFYNAGVKTIKQLYNLKVDEIVALNIGFKTSMATKIYDALHGVLDNPILLATLMSAANVFDGGFGERKLEPLIQAIPDIMTRSELTMNEVKEVPGFSDKTAKTFITGLAKFKEFLVINNFLKIAKSSKKISESTKDTKLNGLIVLFTGFRDKKLEERIIANGGVIGSTLSKKTNVLIAKEPEGTSSKIKEAIQYGILVISVEEFMKRYM